MILRDIDKEVIGERETLAAIYTSDVCFNGSVVLATLRPFLNLKLNTVDITLQFSLSSEYPLTSPVIEIKDSTRLSIESKSNLLSLLHQ
ncbi:MAG: hypothetical protein EZS28_007361 [Streblomastix strix]|uniref:RWD domain-containing protein n=1 Tax=Streblomastix strix TaxID=222440 RepID=A0A5J4WQR9_9EUKA|nr:MAG: hypothetical protein EZS28_007361 [Streblomastix strix]